MAVVGIDYVIDDKYRIISRIGKGGMSTVWLGQDKRVQKLWAIKQYSSSGDEKKDRANRHAILEEAEFIKSLDYPAIPRIVDIVNDGTSIFVVMDYVDGSTLWEELSQRATPFEQDQVIGWGKQLCNVLEYLHSRDIIYRDLKPQNIIHREDDDSVKLIDYGIAAKMNNGVVIDAGICGTPGYSAPEQIDEDIHKVYDVDKTADIYALGATLYSLVTGHIPRRFVDGNGQFVTDFEMKPIRSWNGQLSEGLEHILVKATQFRPADRYQTVAEMRKDLENYEKLTQEYRARQQKIVDGFRKRRLLAILAALIGVLCMGLSSLVRGSSYDALIHEASVADTTERDERIDKIQRTRSAEASEAEELYQRAIEVDPDRIETYFYLVELFEKDGLFTATEARRWTSVWQSYGRRLEDNSRYGKLCFDVGIMYLVYYDYADARSIRNESSNMAATGQAAIENAAQSIRWFQQAANHPASLSEAESNAVRQYVVIGDFYDKVTKANREGTDASSEYEVFWNSIELLVLGDGRNQPEILESEPMVRLRVYQVAFESVNSSTYLTGFSRAGISKERAELLLSTTCAAVKELTEFCEINRDAAGAIFDEITAGEANARSNIARVYKDSFVHTIVDETRGV